MSRRTITLPNDPVPSTSKISYCFFFEKLGGWGRMESAKLEILDMVEGGEEKSGANSLSLDGGLRGG